MTTLEIKTEDELISLFQKERKSYNADVFQKHMKKRWVSVESLEKELEIHLNEYKGMATGFPEEESVRMISWEQGAVSTIKVLLEELKRK